MREVRTPEGRLWLTAAVFAVQMVLVTNGDTEEASQRLRHMGSLPLEQHLVGRLTVDELRLAVEYAAEVIDEIAQRGPL